MNKGKITQVIGPVVDVIFEEDPLPLIKEALKVELNGSPLVMEVAQHMKPGGALYRPRCQRGSLQGNGCGGYWGLHQSAGGRFHAGPHV